MYGVDNKYFISLGVIIFLSIVFSFLYSRTVRKLEYTKILLLAAFSSFVSFLIVLMLNAAGIDYYYFDEAIVTFAYIYIGPNKWLDRIK